MISQAKLLLLSIKSSIIAMYAIVIAFITPIIPLMVIVGGSVILDTIFGVLRARKIKEPVTSRRLSKIISKIVLYMSSIVLVFCVEKYILGDFIGLFTNIPIVATKLITVTLLFIEGMSINENYKVLSGVSVWGKFKDMISRGKELKKDIGEVIEK